MNRLLSRKSISGKGRWGASERNFLKPEAAFSSPTADSDGGLVPSPAQLTNGSEANLVSFVSHFQALIKIICSDCLGKLFFALPFTLLYRYNFRHSRFLRGGVQTALWRDAGLGVGLGGGFRNHWEQSHVSWQPGRWESRTLHHPLDWVSEEHPDSGVEGVWKIPAQQLPHQFPVYT